MINATKYRISTITATGSVNTEVDLDILYDNLSVIINERGVGKNEEILTGVVFVEYGKKRSETYYKGFSKKFLLQKKKETGSKRFDNQLTVIYKYNVESLMNIKIFKNGNIQITGIKQINDGEKMIDELITEIRNIALKKDIKVVHDAIALANNKYKVALINSDFKVDFEIKRDKLFTTMINVYENRCSFEPCIYPGVKIQYFWNINNVHKTGVCVCKESCFNGKGGGNGEGDCKKITIAVFQSGCIIITGAQTTQQIDDAYEFICNVLFRNIDGIKKTTVNPTISTCKCEPKPKIMLKKNLVVYPVHPVHPVHPSSA
jgi:TATA-box binding protein (TBP) (component of TFIID and TFIIIB)